MHQKLLLELKKLRVFFNSIGDPRKKPEVILPSGTRPEKTRTIKWPTRPDPNPKPSGSGRVFTWFGSPTGHPSVHGHIFLVLGGAMLYGPKART